MRDRIATAWSALPAQVVRLAGLFACVILAGCASGGDGPMFFADAGKYRYHNCEQLATAATKQSERQRQLKELIDKAEQAPGGQLVSLMAYRTDYVAVNEDLQVLETAARAKNCPTPSSWQSNSAIR